MKKIYFVLFTVCLFGKSFFAQQTFTNFMAASLVIGQPNFTTQNIFADQFTTYAATSSAISCKGVVAIGSQTGHRVLLYNSIPTTNGAAASIVLGQANFTTNIIGCTQSQTGSDEGIAFSPDGNKLIVADGGNNRILIWNSIPTSNFQNADVVVGQANFFTNTSGLNGANFNYPTGVLVTPDGKLLVSDYNNNRILIFNTIPTTNGASADVVIGQNSFFTNAAIINANGLKSCWYMSLSATGKLVVADQGNHRVLIYNNVPTTNGVAANVVIGQTTFTTNTLGTTQSTLYNPLGVTCSPDGKLAICEYFNHRVLIYNTIPTTNGALANVVLGQPNFTSNTPFNGGVNAQSMRTPYGNWFDLNGRLFVNGRDMNRVMIFGTVPTKTAELSIAMTNSVSSACLNSFVQFSITITNNGPDTAKNIVANTALPVLFNLTGSSPSVGTYSAASGWWSIPFIKNGASATLVLNGTVNTGIPQTLTSYANITASDQVDNILANNGTSSTVAIIPGAPPTGGSINGPTVACSGTSFTYSVTGVTGATSYAWSANGTATVVGSGTLVTVNFGAANSTVNVVPSNSVCPGSLMSLIVSSGSSPTVTASGPPYVCVGQTATLTAGGALTYSWSTGALTPTAAITQTASTFYTVTGTNAAGCSAVAGFFLNLSFCTGIVQNSAINTPISIYPNPSNGKIILSRETASLELDIKIYSVAGLLVHSDKFTGIKKEMNLDLESGLYFVVIEDKETGRAVTGKIVIGK